MQKANGRVLWIDGLRGIACLAIFAHHFGCCFYPVTQYGPDGDWATPASIALAQSPLAVLLNGNFWVCVFCVIAGFVAARSHFTPPGEDGISLRRFSGQLLNRYFRMVLPVFWISLAVLIMVKLQLFTNRAFFETYYIYWSALTYAEDFYTFPSLILETFVKLCFVGTEKYVMVLWSIRLLFYGYFVSILLAQMSWGRNKRILWVYLFLAVGSLFCGLDLCMMGCFPIGTMLAWWSMYGKQPAASPLRSCAAGLLILAGLVLGAYPTFFEPTNFYRYLDLPGVEDVLGVWHVLGAAMLMTGLCLSPALQRALTCRPLQALFSTLHPRIAFALGNRWSRRNRLSHAPYRFRGEDEPLYRWAAAFEKEHPVDYFIFGHYHAEVDMTLPGGARLLMSKSWMEDSPYWYSDGISVFLGHSKKIE